MLAIVQLLHEVDGSSMSLDANSKRHPSIALAFSGLLERLALPVDETDGHATLMGTTGNNGVQPYIEVSQSVQKPMQSLSILQFLSFLLEKEGSSLVANVYQVHNETYEIMPQNMP